MSIARHTIVQSSFTLTSRLLGFMRDILLAGVIGAGRVGDAWATALMFPNLFRRIFAEGAFASAFVPVYARTLEAEGPDAARQIAREAMKVLFAATAVLTILAQVFMPWVLLAIHGGQVDDAEGFGLAVALTRMTMPYLTCMSIAALYAGILNAAQRFVFSAAAPILLNICIIAAVFLAATPVPASQGGQEDGWVAFAYRIFAGAEPAGTAQAAALATFVAGGLQALLLYWGCRRQGVNIGVIGWPVMTANVRRLMLLAIPGTIAASGTQINIMVSQALASFELNAKTLLYYADRLYQLPLGLVGVAVGVAILPRLARAARVGDKDVSNRMLDEGIGLALALVLPAAVALLILPRLLLEGIFARGAFTAENAGHAALALFHYAWGLPAFVLIKVLAPAFFAHEDMKTPMHHALISVVINVGLGVGLFVCFHLTNSFGFRGLAIATSLAAWVNVGLLAHTLLRRGWYRPGTVLAGRSLRILFSCTIMASCLVFMKYNHDFIDEYITTSNFLTTILFIVSGIVCYGLISLWSGAIRLVDFKTTERQKR